MPDRFFVEWWNQTVYAECVDEVHPYTSGDRFRQRNVGYNGNQAFWATPSPEPRLNGSLSKRLAMHLNSDDPVCGAAVNLATKIADRVEASELLFIAILRAGVPVVEWLTRLLPGSVGVATSLFIGHGIDKVSYTNIRADYPGRQIVFVDGWTGKGGVANELSRLGVGPLAVLSDPWGLATFRGTQEDILSPSACFTGPTTLGFSRTFTREPGQCFAAYRFPRDLLESTITRAWVESCPIESMASWRRRVSYTPDKRPSVGGTNTRLRVHSNEVCRALINSNPEEILFRCSQEDARERYDLLIELADSQDIPQRFLVNDLAGLSTQVACTLQLQEPS